MVALLTKLINMLQVFHDSDLILGDFNLSTIYVFNYPDISVLPVSLGQVQTSSSNSDVNVKYKADDISSKRSTPKKSLANKTSFDVYVFGKFLDELLQVINSGEHIYETLPNNQHAALYEAGSVWLQNIAVLMMECLQEDPVKRPTLAEIKSSLLQLHVRGERSNIQEINEKLLKSLENREDNESVYASVDNIGTVNRKPSRPLPPVPKDVEAQHETTGPELQPNSTFSVHQITDFNAHQITDFSAQKINQTEQPHELNDLKETKVQGAPGDIKQYAFSEIPYDNTDDLTDLNTQILKQYLLEYSTFSDISPFSTLCLSPHYDAGAEKEIKPNGSSNTDTMRQYPYSGVKTSEGETRSSRASDKESLKSTSFSVTDTKKELTPSKISRTETLRTFENAIPENLEEELPITLSRISFDYSVPESTEKDLECRNLETLEEMASNCTSSMETIGYASHNIQKTGQEFKTSRGLYPERKICVNSAREENKKENKNEFQKIGKGKFQINHKEKIAMSHSFVMSI
ncbi:uncharacterized protein LOC131928144 [Physella acuta]|uniref:uncharacterized protein LOC131928144 n=1 Tax=Physella acuta TaxID=109671 RepID=UPI0027DD1D1E|nr:uncharacterized protein LOC131928144 [Physella acuta]